MSADLFPECFVVCVEIPRRSRELAHFSEEFSRRQSPLAEFNKLNGRLYSHVTERVSRRASTCVAIVERCELGRELDHRLAEAQLGKELPSARVLARRVEDQAGGAFVAQSVSNRFDQPSRNTLTPLSFTDEDVVQRAAGVKQRVPVP